MKHKADTELIRRFIRRCAKSKMTLDEMARSVGRSKGWASSLVNGRITQLQFGTRNRILEYMGEL